VAVVAAAAAAQPARRRASTWAPIRRLQMCSTGAGGYLRRRWQEPQGWKRTWRRGTWRSDLPV
jgi:hypothetical protein